MKNAYVYKINYSIYINLTNRCTCRCVFCDLAMNKPLCVNGYNLKLEKEPTVEEILNEMPKYLKQEPLTSEVVFCGYGEPTLRLKELKEIAAHLKKQKLYVRLNTNGHANMVHKRNVVPELKGLIDEVRVSLNALDSQEYKRLNRPKFERDAYPAVKSFIYECKIMIPRVVVSAVVLPGLEMDRLKSICHVELGVPFMPRELDHEGVPQKIM